jgi:hypothetical protein
MDQSARTTQRWAIVWILAIAPISVWLNLQPDWRFMRESRWAWPAIEFVHVFGLVGFFGLRTMIDLRLTSRAFVSVRIADLLRKFVPATVFFAAITIASGMALYSATPEIMSARPMFQLKVAVLVIALLNLFYLHAFALPSAEKQEAVSILPISARISALLSISLWGIAIIASLLIPYLT